MKLSLQKLSWLSVLNSFNSHEYENGVPGSSKQSCTVTTNPEETKRYFPYRFVVDSDDRKMKWKLLDYCALDEKNRSNKEGDSLILLFLDQKDRAVTR